MLETLLRPKLYIPPLRPNLVPRPHLIKRLNQGLRLGRKLTLISAPAGFGKTTLVSEWAAHNQQPEPKVRVAWLSLDEGDNELTRFLAYLVAALQTVVPTVGEGLSAALQSSQPPPVEWVLTTLLNEITIVPDNVILALDDYHVIEARAVDDALTFLLEHLPPQMHLVIATREDPPLLLARLRARGQLTEVRPADLRFTPSEAAEFLTQVMGLDLSTDDIAVLENRTEGWIAGLHLAALALQGPLSRQGHQNTTGFIQSFTGSHRFVLDYLVEEVLQRQPERIRRFLLQTAILDKLCGPLCDAVTGQEDGKEMLEVLERGNLFVIPLDDKRHWYRYHHLFAEVLQVRSMAEQPHQLSAWQQRASQWYEHNGQLPDAIRHALAAEDFERAANMLEVVGPSVEESYQSATWLGWVRALPEEMIRARPVLSVEYANKLLGSGEMESAEARLQDAERWLQATADNHERPGASLSEMVVVDEEQFRSLPAVIAIARAYRAQALGDIANTVMYARRALDLALAADHLNRGRASGLLGLTYWASGDLEAANHSFTDFTKSLLTAGKVSDAISTTFVLADIRKVLGCLHEARSVIEQVLQLAADMDEPMPLEAADLYRGLSELYMEWGDMETAVQYLLRGKALGQQTPLLDWQRRLGVTQARMKQIQGDLDGALALLDEAERRHIRTPLPDVHPIAALKTRIWIGQGRLTEAMGWAHEQGLSADDALSYLREFEHVTLARVLMARHQSGKAEDTLHKAIGLLARLLLAAEAGGRMGSVLEILALQALAYQTQEDMPGALATLARALTLAEPEGYRRLFVDEGPPMARLLNEAVSRGIAPDYTRRLLASFSPVGPAPTHASVSQTENIEPLSERELEVLQHIAEGLTNQEIADRLFLSLYTIKAHARNIYGKLGVGNRTQAVARARELQMLSRS